jgi:hypothetical protein
VVDILTNAMIRLPAVLFPGNATDSDGTPVPSPEFDWMRAMLEPPLLPIDTGADIAAVDPAGLVAVTADWMVNPASPDITTYVDCVAPEMAAQLAPELLHRFHW